MTNNNRPGAGKPQSPGVGVGIGTGELGDAVLPEERPLTVSDGSEEQAAGDKPIIQPDNWGNH
jgi:hypothetical protein